MKQIFIIILLIIIIIFVLKQKETFITYKGIEYSDNLNIEEIKNLKKGQVKIKNILKEFDRICRKYNLKYWCIGGTLIGVLRHQGWIPFDGDIDIGIADIDYEQFRNVVKKELPSHIKFTEPKNKPCSKLSDTTAKYIYSKYGNNWDVGNYIMLDIFIFETSNDNKYIGEGNRIFDKKTIFPLKEKMFEDIKVYIPNDYDTYLKKFSKNYQNYMTELPIEKRYPHEGVIEHL
jgi:phosphorylcholine metabolism protein LicD